MSLTEIGTEQIDPLSDQARHAWQVEYFKSRGGLMPAGWEFWREATRRAREETNELEEFLVALKYADVTQFDRVKDDAAKLLRKRNFHIRLIQKARAALEGK